VWSVLFPDGVFWEVQNYDKAITTTHQQSPDIVLMDTGWPQSNDIESIRKIKLLSPRTQIIILTLQDDSEYYETVKEAGATTFIVKQQLRNDLIPVLADLIYQNRETNSGKSI
jgi:DNA-binding NarL/FixJ family response regulator